MIAKVKDVEPGSTNLQFNAIKVVGSHRIIEGISILCIRQSNLELEMKALRKGVIKALTKLESNIETKPNIYDK